MRIQASEHAANNILWPMLSKVLPSYSDIHVEITVDYALSDSVTQRYDAAVRLGDLVAKGMIAVPLGPSLRIAIVGSSEYFKQRPIPKVPGKMAAQKCINLRLQWQCDAVGF